MAEHAKQAIEETTGQNNGEGPFSTPQRRNPLTELDDPPCKI